MNCPHCDVPSFITTEYETVEIDQCKQCHGIWLDQNEMGEIVKNLATDFSELDVKKTISNAFMGIPAQEKETTRKCPKCSSALQPVNYSVDSGVIIDRCPKDHGVWLDHFELEQVQQYREYWQENTRNSLDKFSKLVKKVENSKSTQEDSISLIYDISMKVGGKLFKKPE